MHRLVVTTDDVEVLPSSTLTAGAVSAVARLAFDLLDPNGNRVMRAAEFQGTLEELATWVTANATPLLRQPPPGILPRDGSLAARIAAFYEAADPDDVSALDAVHDYRQRHGLRFAFRGTELPDIYIGLNGPAYEISCVEGAPWAYVIDLSRFVGEITFAHPT